MKRALVIGVVCAFAATSAAWAQTPAPDRFDHARHAKLFPSCVSCHAGALDPSQPLYPAIGACTGCHDGTVRPRVTWVAPRPVITNLRFAHDAHRRAVTGSAGDSITCSGCHTPDGSKWMSAVQVPVPASCVGCHAPGRAHLTQTDSACGQCHVTLAVSPLAVSEVGAFPAPPSHHDSAFGQGGGHGRAATASAVSCAFCHAREFCTTCHADAAALPVITALASDPRSLAIIVRQRKPASHLQPGFLRTHGPLSRQAGATCATCHSQEGCTSCHQGNVPEPVRKLGRATTDRPTGVVLVRHPPTSHADPTWARSHGTEAAARPQSCYGCHAQAQCLSCHRPNAGSPGGYHPAGFLASHPAEAYARESSCAECHNTQGFCQDCHRTAGVTASGSLRAGFHDAQGAFLLSHGQAARQGLETCVSCHAERDCLTCHSATGGRGFDPHGPGFNADQLRSKNPTMCVACHGTNIPTR